MKCYLSDQDVIPRKLDLHYASYLSQNKTNNIVTDINKGNYTDFTVMLMVTTSLVIGFGKIR